MPATTGTQPVRLAGTICGSAALNQALGARAHGLDPVHFGIMMIVNLEIGYLTPPLGLNLYVAMTAFRQDFLTVARAALPFIALLLVGLAVVSLWPALSLFAIR